MVAFAATRDRAALWQAYDQLRSHGGVELGDLVLASGGIASNTTDEQLAAALAPLAAQPVARYLIAGRAFSKAQRPERLRPDARDGVTDGLVRALWSLRAATAYTRAGNARAAADQVVAIGNRAPELRLVGAATMSSQWRLGPDDIGRAWDAAATGAYRNVARAAAAQTLYQRGLYEAGVDRVVALVGDLDLQALPPRLDGVASWFNASRRGPAGWQMVWATWRDRVLAGTSYDHVMALVSGPAQQAGDVTPILARAAQLAGNDGRRTLEVARAAIALGHAAWAEAVLRSLVKSPLGSSPGSPLGHDLHQLVANIELQQGRLAEALADLEAAQDTGADAAVAIATMRAELVQIINVARRLAVQSAGAAREHAVAHALAWGDRWRAIDPGNTEIDRRLGELMLAIGDTTGAWRQLSSTIERDPWSGAGYAVVADAFERQGKITDALAFWQQAIVIDQTDPTPRLRKAQALIALGRTAEGDALLSEIANRRWHDMWSTVVYQARELLERGRRSPR
jgi:tetratricopeptide (TPR) repeat protein